MELEEIKQRMHNGKIYDCNDESLVNEQLMALELLYEFNHTRPTQQEKRQELLKKMFADIGKDCYIEPPFNANWAGRHIHFGDEVYANFNLTLVDDTHIYVGNKVMFAPNVTVATATHPISPRLRANQIQYNLPVRIGNNVWIGANTTILPGVTIGDNSVIGAGSVVTKDIPSGVVAFGVPCVVSRKITEEDEKYYNKNQIIDL